MTKAYLRSLCYDCSQDSGRKCVLCALFARNLHNTHIEGILTACGMTSCCVKLLPLLFSPTKWPQFLPNTPHLGFKDWKTDMVSLYASGSHGVQPPPPCGLKTLREMLSLHASGGDGLQVKAHVG